MIALVFLSAIFAWITAYIGGYAAGKDYSGGVTSIFLAVSIILLTLSLWLASLT